MRTVEKECDEIYRHYGMEKDKEAVKDGKIKEIDFLIGKEEDIGFLTNGMAGFGMEQSQRVIIEYDKGYGYFIAKRLRMEYGALNDAPKKSGFFQMFLDRARFIFVCCRIFAARTINRKKKN